ncbi:MAG TPA: hypothetical protein VLF59_00865 [Candidatus Saccharimonadales bacterium]|nr:hypothetical protein [Candidatus Saccharimonadales bacterium]
MTSETSHIVIFSHGFGVRKEDRGLFTAISRALPEAESVLFNYNPINEQANTLTAEPLGEQVLKLRKVINTVRAEHPGAVIDLVCHSQGCVVAALLKPRYIRKIIMITPPDDLREATVAKQLGTRREVPIDTSVRTRLARSDGSTTVIHPEYWQSLAGIEPVKLYNRLARFTALRVIKARHDEVLGDVSFTGIDPGISLVTLDGTHNFEGEESRNRLLHILRKELMLSPAERC